MLLKYKLLSQLKEILENLALKDVDPELNYPDPAQGDYATNVAFVVAKKLHLPPMEVAERIVKELRSRNQESRMFQKIEVAKPGFINFTIGEKELLESLETKITPEVHGKKVVVEYSSPNIAKPFTIGHLRSTIIGDAIANLLQANGWKVFRDNHVGDWGTQFGKQIYAIKHISLSSSSLSSSIEGEKISKLPSPKRRGQGEVWGEGDDVGRWNEELLDRSDRPVKLLVDLYVKFHEEAENHPEFEEAGRAWFKKLEDGDPEARRLWKKCIEWSWKEFHAIYKELGIAFTENEGRGYGEAFFEGKMDSVIQELQAKHLLTTGEEGAKIVGFPKETKLPPLMILKKDGATLYSTRDLATDKFRKEIYGNDVVIVNEVGAEQALYFRQLYQLEEMLGWFSPGQRIHIKHGLYRFKDQKMSTRKGNVIWLEDVLNEAERRAAALAKSPENSETAKVVGIGAIKWNDLKRSPEQDIVFDWNDILNMQGNSGPYLQYTYARTQSVLAKTKRATDVASVIVSGKRGNERIQNQPGIDERQILVLLSRFPEIVEGAAKKFAPNILCSYLFDLAQAFNLFYQKYPILKAGEEERELRLFLTEKTGEVIKEGLHILGIEAPKRM